METLRPAVEEDDGPISKIIKYIPAEIIAVYTAIVGVVKPAANSGPLEVNVQRDILYCSVLDYCYAYLDLYRSH